MATHLTDEPRLVAAAQDGDENAFCTLINHYYWNIYNIVFKIAKNQEDTEDALQEAFLKSYCNVKRFQGNSRFYTWLVRIAVNEALMKLRKKRADRQVPLEEVAPCVADRFSLGAESWSSNPERRYAELEAQEILDEALSFLSPRLCRAFRLRNVEDLSMEETAEKLGLSASAVKSRLVRARSRLRRRLRSFFPAEYTAYTNSQELQQG